MRKSRPKKRILLPDPRYKDAMVTRFVNNLMKKGEKNTSYAIFYRAISKVEEKLNEKNGLDVWRKAVSNLMPLLEVKSRRVGGATFQIPTEIRNDRKTALSMKWLIDYSRARNEKSMSERLAMEIIAASKNEGAAIKKKEDTHRMAEANKAFAHFRS